MSDLPPAPVTEPATTDDDPEWQAALEAIFHDQGVDPVPAADPPPVADQDAEPGTPAPDSAPDAAPSSASGDLDQDASTTATEVDEVLDPTANLIDLGDGLFADHEQLADLLSWSNSLTPEQAAAVQRALNDPAASGSGHPAPVPGYGQALPGAGGAPYPPQYQQYPPQNVYPTYPPQGYAPAVTGVGAVGQPGVPVTPAQAAGDPRAILAPIEEFVPGITDYISTLHATQAQQAQALEFYQRQQADLAARAAADEQARREAQIAAGHEAFKSSHPELTDVDLHYLATRAANLQVMGGLVQQHHGDVSAAYQEALTTAMFSDPTYRDRAVQSQVDKFATDLQSLEQRKADAASLSGSGGSVPRSPQPAPAEMTPDARRAAMAQFIAQAANS